MSEKSVWQRRFDLALEKLVGYLGYGQRPGSCLWGCAYRPDEPLEAHYRRCWLEWFAAQVPDEPREYDRRGHIYDRDKQLDAALETCKDSSGEADSGEEAPLPPDPDALPATGAAPEENDSNYYRVYRPGIRER